MISKLLLSFIFTVHAADKDTGIWEGHFTTNTKPEIKIVHTSIYIQIGNFGYLQDINFAKNSQVCGLYLENGLKLKINSTPEGFVKALKYAGIYEDSNESDSRKRPYN